MTASFVLTGLKVVAVLPFESSSVTPDSLSMDPSSVVADVTVVTPILFVDVVTGDRVVGISESSEVKVVVALTSLSFASSSNDGIVAGATNRIDSNDGFIVVAVSDSVTIEVLLESIMFVVSVVKELLPAEFRFDSRMNSDELRSTARGGILAARYTLSSSADAVHNKLSDALKTSLGSRGHLLHFLQDMSSLVLSCE